MDRSAEGEPQLRLGPRAVERPTDHGTTLVAGLDGRAPARVDGGGLVSAAGASWSLDWWVGADDRWHLPAREPSVRQARIGFGPIVETSVRVPSGDVVHTTYPVQVDGRTATVIEVRNDSPVPVALAMAVRPYGPEGEGVAGSAGITLSIDDTVVMVDDQPAVILPRPPNQAGALTDGDLLTTVEAGQPLTWDQSVSGPTANAICLYPLPHQTSLRFVIPEWNVDPASPVSPSGIRPSGLADPATAARGWTAVVERAARFEFPDPGLTALAGAARARLVIEAANLPSAVLATAPGAGVALAGLAAGGHRIECNWSLDALAQGFPTALGGAGRDGAEVVVGVAAAATLVHDATLTDRALEGAVQLTRLVERAVDPEATGLARRGLAQLVALTGQFAEAARLSAEDADDGAPWQIDALDGLEGLGPAPAPTGRFGVDDDPVAAARYWLAAHSLLLRHVPVGLGDDRGDHPPGDDEGGDRPRRRWRGRRDGPVAAPPLVVDVLPVFPTAWRGGTVEVHEAPVDRLRVSFAVRWHGFRPALLWDLGDTGGQPVRLRCPGLDPEWSTDEPKGETLLTGSAEELPAAPAPGDSFS